MMKRHRQPLQAMDAINVTNLLDTAFILLVTFMLVAPQLSHSLRVTLPQVPEPGVATPAETKKEPLLIIIQKRAEGEAEERLYVKQGAAGKEEGVSIAQLTDIVTQAKAANPDLAVVLEMDTASTAGMILPVLAVLTKANVENIGVPFSPEKREKEKK